MFQNPLVGTDELLYFADVCAGPGGFSEYVLSRRKWRSKGFGFMLKGDNDFKLADFYAGPCESFEPHYGKSCDLICENNLNDVKTKKRDSITSFEIVIFHDFFLNVKLNKTMRNCCISTFEERNDCF